MPGDNVRLAVYARLSDGLVLASHKGRATDAANTAKKVLESGNLKPNAQLTVTVTPEIGTLHLAAGDVDVVAVITATEYPRRAAFKLLDEIRGQVSEAAISAEDVAEATKEGALKSLLPFLRDRAGYEDLAEVDKLTAVGAQVDEVKATMEGNINRMLDNAETVGAVEDKSRRCAPGAQQFQRRSDNVRRMMWWRLVKLKIINLGTLVICILGYIIVPIISAANDDSK